jgi:polysaccharide export outer membrane protein
VLQNALRKSHDAGWLAVTRKRFRESLRAIPFVMGVAILLIASRGSAQDPAGRDPAGQDPAKMTGQFREQVRTSDDINQRLRQLQETLGGPSRDSRTDASRLGPDDLLMISVFEAPEMNATVRISSGGEISLQLLGPMHAAGLTPQELESVVQARLRQSYMKDPHVGVFVQELQSHSVSVVGAVKAPGVFQIRGTKTVIEVLSMAQGLADDAGDTVLVMHTAASSEAADFPDRHAAKPRTVIFPAAYELLGQPDGPKPRQNSNLGTEEIDLKKLLESADSAANVPVGPGDIVKVPRAGIVYVVGEVQKPGGFVLQNNERISVLQAVALAQGFTHTSAIRQARIIRTDSVTGKRTEIPANLAKILAGKAPDTFLQPKDTVFVPNSAAKSVLYRGSTAALQTATGVAIYRW